MIKTVMARCHMGQIKLVEPLPSEEGEDIMVTDTYPESLVYDETPTTSTAGDWQGLLDCDAFQAIKTFLLDKTILPVTKAICQMFEVERGSLRQQNRYREDFYLLIAAT